MRTKKETIPKRKDIVEAARTGDRLEALIALRDLLAERLKNAGSDRDIASISRRLMQCVYEIEAIEKDRKSDNGKIDLAELRTKFKLDGKKAL